VIRIDSVPCSTAVASSRNDSSASLRSAISAESFAAASRSSISWVTIAASSASIAACTGLKARGTVSMAQRAARLKPSAVISGAPA